MLRLFFYALWSKACSKLLTLWKHKIFAMKKYTIYFISLILVVGLMSYVFINEDEHANPLKEILDKTPESKLPMFVILYNMDVAGWSDSTENSARCRHKYKVITNANNPRRMEVSITEFLPVSKEEFTKQYHNLDMQIASKIHTDQGIKTSFVASPPGYAHYIGNKKMGKWAENRKEDKVTWRFKRRYRNLARVCNAKEYAVSQIHFMDYAHNYQEKNPYYGSSKGVPLYGTGSHFSRDSRRTSPFYEDERETRARNFYRYQKARIGRNGKNIRSRGGNAGK